MPKFNMYQALHTTVIGPEGRPLEIQIHPQDCTTRPSTGIAAHWIYKDDGYADGKTSAHDEDRVEWLEPLLDWQRELKDPQEFVEGLKVEPVRGRRSTFTSSRRRARSSRSPPAPPRSTSPTRSTPTWATAASARR